MQPNVTAGVATMSSRLAAAKIMANQSSPRKTRKDPPLSDFEQTKRQLLSPPMVTQFGGLQHRLPSGNSIAKLMRRRSIGSFAFISSNTKPHCRQKARERLRQFSHRNLKHMRTFSNSATSLNQKNRNALLTNTYSI